MGSGASNQVKASQSISELNREAGCSSLSGYEIKQTGNENIQSSTSGITSINKSNNTFGQSIVTNKSEKTSRKSETSLSKKSQNPEIRSLPSSSCYAEYRPTSRNISNPDLLNKIRELELALAMSESNKLDLLDQVKALEERCSSITEKHSPSLTNSTDTLHETLKSKDQHIQKLEEDLKNAQMNFQRKTLKYKKRVRGLTKQIFELRQEASITQMEMKAKKSYENDLTESHLLNTPVSSEDKEKSYVEPAPDMSHTKIIVELSTQISEQEEQIARLTAEVSEKTERIEKLEAALKEVRKTESKTCAGVTSWHTEASSTDAAAINRGLFHREESHDTSINHAQHLLAFSHIRNGTSTYTRSNNNSHSGVYNKPAIEHQSTALSDSDSDWGEGPSLPNIHRHSAPAQSRMKRSLPKSYAVSTKTRDISYLNEGDSFMDS